MRHVPGAFCGKTDSVVRDVDRGAATVRLSEEADSPVVRQRGSSACICGRKGRSRETCALLTQKGVLFCREWRIGLCGFSGSTPERLLCGPFLWQSVFCRYIASATMNVLPPTKIMSAAEAMLRAQASASATLGRHSPVSPYAAARRESSFSSSARGMDAFVKI